MMDSLFNCLRKQRCLERANRHVILVVNSRLPQLRSLQVSSLIILAFIRSHVAAASVLLVGAWHTALIGLEQIALAIGAATRVARHLDQTPPLRFFGVTPKCVILKNASALGLPAAIVARIGN